ncbi:DUF3192 domain-containing protein [Shewanella sp. A32]|uniref:DUF3192 domain-containing protein n=1 Tax=Shewanella sp. A32 TaxID=3031327 RepID=UPI0023B8E29A|nr:DUF3192 domain-containing protein [Shewanella sp. A32]MDF0534524.1 DUF3192 domain-containing protein [Shewanella sp. A32]
MKSKIPVVIGTLFLAYMAFVAVIVLVYEPNPDDMSWEDRQAYNQEKLTEIKLGQSGEEIITMMGRPDFSEAKLSQGQALNILFYRTHQTKPDGATTKDECTPLLFRNDRLIAWGEDTYQQYLKSATDTDNNALINGHSEATNNGSQQLSK